MNGHPIELPLRDIHLPDPIAWWPLAFGWWLVAGMILLCLVFTIILWRKFRQQTLKKEALTALNLIEKSFIDTENGTQCVTELSILLRKAALSLPNHRAAAAGLTGTAWLTFLDQIGKSQSPLFCGEIGQLLISAPYQPSVGKEEAAQLIQLCRTWVEGL